MKNSVSVLLLFIADEIASAATMPTIPCITFEKILIENDILWNDLVEIEVFNPNYVKTFFGKYPKTIKFFGALGYQYGDNDVRLFVEDDDKPFETKIIYFNFEQILNIKKWSK